MLRGLCTVTYFADDVAAAHRWYAEVLGIEAYFVRPELPAPAAYVEFRVGDRLDELGILDRQFGKLANRTDEQSAPTAGDGSGGTVVYWSVDDIESTVDRLVALGATPHDPVTERGEGFVTASVLDPFGNILGVMENAHYRAMTARSASSG